MKHIKTINENSSINEKRESAKRLLQTVINGDAKDVEGIKLSKEMASAYLDWLEGSVYGKKFGTLPFNMLFDASFNWGINRYAKGKLAKELKDIKAKYKTVRVKEDADSEESIDESASTEEKRIATRAIKSIAKYLNRDLETSAQYLINAAEDVQRDIKKGKIK
jgi:hypothetical protein|tara:strand:+ start:455 stop:946 length:492 start_codon:yes stop_codon:yes gene_type:complete